MAPYLMRVARRGTTINNSALSHSTRFIPGAFPRGPPTTCTDVSGLAPAPPLTATTPLSSAARCFSSITSAGKRIGVIPVAVVMGQLSNQPQSQQQQVCNMASSSSSTLSSGRRLNINNINPHVKAAKYAVRGELAVKSEEYRAYLQGGLTDLPFSEVISANIGNPQQLDQKPITFFRQVLSLLENPVLLEKEDVLINHLGYKEDAIERAKKLLKVVGSVGAYSASNGVPAIRQSIADFLERRDGFSASQSDIYLSAGASSGVNTLLHVICKDSNTGILVPIPQYPLYTASLAVLDAQCVEYHLDESKNWGTDLDIIKQSYEAAKAKGIDVRAIVIINPGNPTGASLSEEDIRSVIEFARQEHLVILADEVYQTNVFIGEFVSFKKVLRQLQKEQPNAGFDQVELASLHSVSKGMVGECGHRGGYFELVNFDPEVQQEIYKFVSIMLCAPVIGQCLVDLMVNPPRSGQPSYPLYKKEYGAIYDGLKERATALHKAFEQMEGVECGSPQGSMYLFPTINLPPKAAEAARSEGMTPDEFYCMRLLEATGVCVVPGSGFGQKDGSLHFRTTFLAPGTEWVGSIVKFHKEFMDKYR
ncbi:putative Aspartate/tyrosine/aromatic aminotransferase [Triangularia setosa]|uniref:Glutamate pyruvate transaminase n=1 Tax=Triangularia setosa TaxID=2587417 RepID=A0AAN6W8B8_9PEZI|nr:putative Aspartate/tyrosine/aromatic aminotransferase [Podospora setosa]